MNLVFQAIVIGIIQGLTEFIPVSSSAHLELAPWIFGWESSPLIGSLAFDVFLHLGTLVALLGLLLARLGAPGRRGAGQHPRAPHRR